MADLVPVGVPEVRSRSDNGSRRGAGGTEGGAWVGAAAFSSRSESAGSLSVAVDGGGVAGVVVAVVGEEFGISSTVVEVLGAVVVVVLGAVVVVVLGAVVVGWGTVTVTVAVAQAPSVSQIEYLSTSVPGPPTVYLIRGDPWAMTTADPFVGGETIDKVDGSRSDPLSLAST